MSQLGKDQARHREPHRVRRARQDEDGLARRCSCYGAAHHGGAFAAGEIVLADWRDALPKEANKLRPAIVVEAEGLFHPDYPNLLLVPLTEDSRLGMPDLVVRIEPSAENGCAKPSVILATHVMAISKRQARRTGARITPEELRQMRERIAIPLGLA